MLVDRIAVAVEASDQSLEVALTPGAGPFPGSRVAATSWISSTCLPDRLLLGSHQVQAPVDAGGQPAQLLLCEPPFFASRFRWSDSRTSSSASAIRKPGG